MTEMVFSLPFRAIWRWPRPFSIRAAGFFRIAVQQRLEQHPTTGPRPGAPHSQTPALLSPPLLTQTRVCVPLHVFAKIVGLASDITWGIPNSFSR